MAASVASFAYDQVLYPGQPFPQTHPDRMATTAILFGMAPAPVPTCRVLELGCGEGANLIPMAVALPEAEFVGIDLSARAIALGQNLIEALKLERVSLNQMDILDVAPAFGVFDYIIAHGVYSWVPEPVRERLMAICAANLAPQGVAYVSYNVYPGCHLRQMLREMMLFHVRAIDEPNRRIEQSLAFLDLLAQAQTVDDTYRVFLRKELDIAVRRGAQSLYHDDLAEFNHPVFFHQFAEHAGRHGLQYLGEADAVEMDHAIPGADVPDVPPALGRHA
jgi:SAM-dependent methyltransferase